MIVLPYYLIKNKIIQLVFNNDLSFNETIRFIERMLSISKEWTSQITLKLEYRLDLSSIGSQYPLKPILDWLDRHSLVYQLVNAKINTTHSHKYLQHQSRIIKGEVGYQYSIDLRSVHLEYPNLKQLLISQTLVPSLEEFQPNVDYSIEITGQARILKTTQLHILFGTDFFTRVGLVSTKIDYDIHQYTCENRNGFNRISHLTLALDQPAMLIIDLIRCSRLLTKLELEIETNRIYSVGYFEVILDTMSSLSTTHLSLDYIYMVLYNAPFSRIITFLNSTTVSTVELKVFKYIHTEDHIPVHSYKIKNTKISSFTFDNITINSNEYSLLQCWEDTNNLKYLKFNSCDDIYSLSDRFKLPKIKEIKLCKYEGVNGSKYISFSTQIVKLMEISINLQVIIVDNLPPKETIQLLSINRQLERLEIYFLDEPEPDSEVVDEDKENLRVELLQNQIFQLLKYHQTLKTVRIQNVPIPINQINVIIDILDTNNTLISLSLPKYLRGYCTTEQLDQFRKLLQHNHTIRYINILDQDTQLISLFDQYLIKSKVPIKF
ncbi:hypothetical protein DLAC_04372 [Tieghemostelium lacteum]|uniref:Uncharacterized protein n=1 Tax=Tieghemostelium lacteum TaxID=361077 RepID=A0A151ZJV2_TIELA|nr:hypothetical protein DLAC_04372 [Tieghemostelium lacteum]|eukprot:KYQ94094.1 hypothetical protein DLAC_04372 [Tieghemostelium lacteum]